MYAPPEIFTHNAFGKYVIAIVIMEKKCYI